ncbi:MAG TPA: hypothetical protein VMM36_03875 [Opitutaceae bacterium]|nr:hypothetical protein [Opitutaceae bacterium]
MNPPARSTRLLEWLVVAALFALTLGSRWTLIAQHGVPVPFHDQWSAEGEAILEPWFAGELGWKDFFKPSNEHRPVLTRLLAFAEFRLTGQWDTRTQMFVNSFFYALAAVALSLLARRMFSTAGWMVATVALASVFTLPGNYENAVWGFQLHFYLMVLLAVLYLGGTFGTSRVDARWVAAQAAGALGLLSIAGGLLAPVAAAGIAAVRLARRRDAHGVATLCMAVALALVGWWLLPPTAVGGKLDVFSSTILVEALVKMLAWPSPVALAAALVQLPWLIVAVRTFVSREARPAELVLTALGGWVVMQALAIAYARGASFPEIPPRYTDILVIGLAANAACAAILVRDSARKLFPFALCAVWLATVSAGLWHFNRPARIGPILEVHADLHRRTLAVVRDYIRTGDPAALGRDAFVAHHFPPVSTMRRLLDNPGIRASLPPEVQGDESQSSLERLVALCPIRSKWLGYISMILLPAAVLVAIYLIRRQRIPDESLRPTPWFYSASVIAAVALVLVAAGMRPWDSDSHRRISQVLDDAGTAATGFDVPDAAGRIFALPATPAGLFFGTYIEGDGFTGEFVSSEFAVDSQFLIVPVTGYPNGPGNSLRFDFLRADGTVQSTTAFSDNTPGEKVLPWMVTVRASPGARARIVLTDGSTEPRGWLGVGTPRLTDDPAAARRMGGDLGSIGAENARRFPATLLVASVFCAIAGLVERLAARRRDLASAVAH